MPSNPSLQPTCYGLRPSHAAELKRYAAYLLASVGVAACATKPPESETALNSCFEAYERPGWSLIDSPPEAERLISMIPSGGSYPVLKGLPTYWFGSADGHYTACWLPKHFARFPAWTSCSRTKYHFFPSGGAWGFMPGEVIICDAPPVLR
jgi:hypothetical protein